MPSQNSCSLTHQVLSRFKSLPPSLIASTSHSPHSPHSLPPGVPLPHCLSIPLLPPTPTPFSSCPPFLQADPSCPSSLLISIDLPRSLTSHCLPAPPHCLNFPLLLCTPTPSLQADPSCTSSLIISVDLPRSLTSLLLSSLPLIIGSALSLALCTSSYLFSHSFTHSSPSLHTLPSLLSLITSSPWPSFSSNVSRSLLSSLITFSLLHSLSHSSHSSLPFSHSHHLESPHTHESFPTVQPRSASSPSSSSSSHPLPLYLSLLSPLLLSLPSLPRLSPTLTSFLHSLNSFLQNQPHHATSYSPLLASARCMLSCIFSTLTSASVSLFVAAVIASTALCFLVASLKVTLSTISCCAGSRSGLQANKGSLTCTQQGYWPALLFLFLLLPLALVSPFLALLLAAAAQITRASQAKSRSSRPLVSELLVADALLLLVTSLFHLPPFIAHLHAKASVSLAPVEDILPSISSLLLIVTPPPCSSQHSPTLHYKPTALQQVVGFVCFLCGMTSFVFSLYLVPAFCLQAVAVVAMSRFIMCLSYL
ncbi:unnamed protein product [Closterium sp. NIES-54]